MKTPIYYLHIPRTSGVFIRDKVLFHSEQNQKSFLSTHKINIGLEDFENKDYISGHYGLTPIPYVSTTFTILRDPIERTFSYMKYIWEHFYNYTSMDEAFMFFLTNKNFKEILSNQQSNFLTSQIDINEYNTILIDTLFTDSTNANMCIIGWNDSYFIINGSIKKFAILVDERYFFS
jgi:hypothetical protein